MEEGTAYSILNIVELQDHTANTGLKASKSETWKRKVFIEDTETLSGCIRFSHSSIQLASSLLSHPKML
jgi:hypothetical protein